MEIKIQNPDPLDILRTTKYVVENSTFVSINPAKIEKLIPEIKRKIDRKLENTDYQLGITGNYRDDLQLVFIQDVVNFCFWSEKGKEKWKLEFPEGHIIEGGWFGLVGAFRRARKEGMPVLDADFLMTISLKEIKHLFESVNNIEIPLLEKRRQNLQEAGKILKENYGGHFANLLEKTGLDAVSIVKDVVANFSSFSDMAGYKGKKVNFYKRAQIVASDLSYLSDNGKRLKITGLGNLTAFADYKLPQILRNEGILVYSKELAKKVDNYELLEAGSEEEVEIRASTIWAIEIIRQRNPGYTAAEIDNAVWLISQDQSKVEKPYHRTYTIFY